MRMTLYETVKSNVTTLQAAERYGLKVGHGGMCKCPFHNDKNPSMKVDKRFHCFGCHLHSLFKWNVISLYSLRLKSESRP